VFGVILSRRSGGIECESGRDCDRGRGPHYYTEGELLHTIPGFSSPIGTEHEGV
jgi:hypothetical protein